MRKICSLLLLFLFSYSAIVAQNEKEIFQKAVQDFEGKNMLAALKSFLTLEKNGMNSSDLYFNIGTVYLQMDSIAPAVYYLEKAHRISPWSSAIKSNLEIANSRTIDEVKPMPKLFFIQWLENIQNTFSSSTWAIFFILINIVLVCLLLLLLNQKYLKFKFIQIIGSVICVLLMMMFIKNSIDRKDYESSSKIGISFKSNVKGFSQPFSNADEVFTIHEGTKFRIQETKQDWTLILLADGRDGWIENNHFKTL